MASARYGRRTWSVGAALMVELYLFAEGATEATFADTKSSVSNLKSLVSLKAWCQTLFLKAWCQTLFLVSQKKTMV